MGKQHRMLLLAIVVVAVAAIAGALPSPADPLHTEAITAREQTNTRAQLAVSVEPTIGLWNARRPIAGSHLTIRLGDGPLGSPTSRIASENVLRDMLDGKPALLLGRRASAHHPTKRLLSIVYVSARTTIHESAARLLHSLIPVSASTLTAALDIPLNRGPTPSAC